MEVTLASILGCIIWDRLLSPGMGILHHEEGVDLLPANIELSGLEVTLVNVMSRETVLRKCQDMVRDDYDVGDGETVVLTKWGGAGRGTDI